MLGTNFGTRPRDSTEKLAARNFQAKIFSRDIQIKIKMNGDVDMIDASSNSDTVAILDAGAQYGKVFECDALRDAFTI